MEGLRELYRDLCGEYPVEVIALQASGSHRKYFRLNGKRVLMGVVGTCFEENRAFLTLDSHFRSRGINAPEVLAVSGDGMRYVQEDLGDTLLFDAIALGRECGHYSDEERALLRKVISKLPDIQFACREGFDWNVCYPEPAFDGRMVSFDLNYFKYCFLKATGLEFDEVRLQDDFDALQKDLTADLGDTFMYRDFQARNVMIKDGEPWFIDFQGGRKGPVWYDLASFVWQARSRYPDELRKELEDSYIAALRKYVPDLDEEAFAQNYRLFVLFRTLQVLGAYGFRGYFEKKPHFLGSVPFAIDNLRKLLRTPFVRYPYLNEVLTKLTGMSQFYQIAEDKRLEVSIFSFSYKKGIPADTSGNGGGYVFDCRSINNPGKYDYYRNFTGMDPEVIKFLEDDGEMTRFMEHVYAIVDPHVARFIERKFTHLQVCFGCTGGQHRSVYGAEHLAAHLSAKFDVKIVLRHRELDIEKLF
ncbi:MAG: phosphotransferase [Bacteroidales bacterium]|nr:phosphotransferase [Bacteroidales bacterium]